MKKIIRINNSQTGLCYLDHDPLGLFDCILQQEYIAEHQGSLMPWPLQRLAAMVAGRLQEIARSHPVSPDDQYDPLEPR